MPMGQMQKVIKMNVGTSEELWPYQVVDVIEARMEHGLAKHPDGDSWDETPEVMIARATKHLSLLKKKDTSDDHLAAAFTDIMMAVAIRGGYGESEFTAMVAERDKKKGGAGA